MSILADSYTHSIRIPVEERRTKVIRSIRFSSPTLTTIALILSDVLALSGAVFLAVVLRLAMGVEFNPLIYFRFWPLIPLFVVGFAAVRLYPALPVNPTDEMRRVFIVLSLIFLALGTVMFLTRIGTVYSRGVFLSAWVLSFILVLVFRSAARSVLFRQSWWGLPAVIFGSGRSGRNIVKHLLRHPSCGVKPVAIVTTGPVRRNSFGSIPVVSDLDQVISRQNDRDKLCGIIAAADMLPHAVTETMREHERLFRRVMIVPDLNGVMSLGVGTRDIGGMLGLEVQHRLLDPWRLGIKRCMDLMIVVLITPIVLSLIAVITVLIKIESRGPAFYGDDRIGRNGSIFRAWKFRSMVHNASEVLDHYLSEHPELRKEWNQSQKIKNDPRMTRVGRFLRRFSLDELPQVWNVLVGEMSIVGPRPIMPDEVSRYREAYSDYLRVRPGITGLWQVSGRNDLRYSDRIRMNSFYIRNWSVWLDLHVLSRTISAILSGRGAY